MPNGIDSFTVRTKVLVPPFHNYYFNLEIEGWIVTPTSGGTEYTKVFPKETGRADWIKSVEDLRFILLACFLDDFSPRVIDRFEIEGLNGESLMSTILIFGNDQNDFSLEDRSRRAFDFSGDLFNGAYNNDPHYQPNIELIKEWFNLFKQNIGLATNLNLIQQSFVQFNKYFGKFSYFDPTDLHNGIIFLVSGLEGIFLKNQNDKADLLFKFSTIGTIYYDRYAKEDLINRFGMGSRKFSIKEFREILKELYKLRSMIAHGNYQELNRSKSWKKLLDLKSVGHNDNDDIQMVLKNVSLALGLFEKHILSIIVGAKVNLLKGVDIIDEVAFTYT